MKIIAKVNESMLLCEVSATEIAKLHGCENTYDRDYDKRWIEVGQELRLDYAIEALKSMRSFDYLQMANVKTRLVGLLNDYDKMVEEYQKVTLFDKLKNAGKEETND